jgi:hypothetical protein
MMTTGLPLAWLSKTRAGLSWFNFLLAWIALIVLNQEQEGIRL